jgi:hypothetical protein
MPARSTFKYISNATTTDGKQLTGHVTAAAILVNENSTLRPWTRLRVFCEHVFSCDLSFVVIFAGLSFFVLSAGLASVERHAMHSADACATCRVLTTPNVVLRTFLVMNVTRATSPRRTTEVARYLLKRCPEGTVIPAGDF